MWIFSLGVTLKQTISSPKYSQISSDCTTANDDNKIADVYHLSKSVNDVNNQYYYGIGKQTTDHLTTQHVSALDKIVLAMCEPKSIHRASLMFLLDVSIVKKITLLLLFFFFTRVVKSTLVWLCLLLQ